MRAANYAKDQFTQWGLTGSMLDPWGGFGKSWELEKSYVSMTAPWYNLWKLIQSMDRWNQRITQC